MDHSRFVTQVEKIADWAKSLSRGERQALAKLLPDRVGKRYGNTGNKTTRLWAITKEPSRMSALEYLVLREARDVGAENYNNTYVPDDYPANIGDCQSPPAETLVAAPISDDRYDYDSFGED